MLLLTGKPSMWRLVGGEVLGRRDLDADGVPELFVNTGSGASTDLIGVFGVQDCRAVPLTMGGSPAEFPVGAALSRVGPIQPGSRATAATTAAINSQAFPVWVRHLGVLVGQRGSGELHCPV